MGFFVFCGIISEVEDLSEIIERRTTPGILIFDLNDRLLYLNEEASKMIPELTGAVTGKIKIPGEIYNLCNQVKSTAKAASAIREVEHSGLRSSLQAFFIGRQPGDKNPTHIMVLVERIVERHDADFEKARTDYKLTNRELEVLRLLCHGLTNREISERLFISEYTVKDHIKKIMEKIGVSSRSKIIALLK